jgi:replicative DNA helicase
VADLAPPDHLFGLASQDFGSRLNREIFTAVTDLALARPDLDLPARDEAIAAMITRPGASLEDLQAWRQDAPNRAAIASYAQLVRTAAIYRDLASCGDDVARTLAASVNTPDADLDLVHHNQRLAVALTRHAEAFRPISAPAPGTPDADHQINAGVEPLAAPSQQSMLEDQLLADLLRDPEQILPVASFLSDNAFSSPLRRHVYRTMTSLAYDAEPVDEVTVAWTVEIQTSQARLHGIDVNAPGSTPDERPHPTSETDTEPAPIYLARLAATTITVTSAVHAARDLLAAHLRASLPAAGSVAAAAATALRPSHPTTTSRQHPNRQEPPVLQPGPAPRPAHVPLPAPQPGTGPSTAPTSPRIRP